MHPRASVRSVDWCLGALVSDTKGRSGRARLELTERQGPAWELGVEGHQGALCEGLPGSGQAPHLPFRSLHGGALCHLFSAPKAAGLSGDSALSLPRRLLTRAQPWHAVSLPSL